MVVTQHRPKKKASGGRYGKNYRKKRLYESGNSPIQTKIDHSKIKTVRTVGGSSKKKLLSADIVNVVDQKKKKAFKAKILTEVDNPANKHFIRRNILTKGAIVDTDKGKVKITSRPGQEGSVNGILVE